MILAGGNQTGHVPNMLNSESLRSDLNLSDKFFREIQAKQLRIFQKKGKHRKTTFGPKSGHAPTTREGAAMSHFQTLLDSSHIQFEL